MVTESELKKLYLERIRRDILFVLKTESPKTWLDLADRFSGVKLDDARKCLFEMLDEDKVMLTTCEDRTTALFYVEKNPPSWFEINNK